MNYLRGVYGLNIFFLILWAYDPPVKIGHLVQYVCALS